MNDLIEKLSSLRSQFNCFDKNENDAYHTLSEAIKALTEHPHSCEDTVSRKTAVDALDEAKMIMMSVIDSLPENVKNEEAKIRIETISATVDSVKQILEKLPSVTPKRKTGKWITESLADDFAFVYSLKCSECGKYYGWEHNFCPNCGADMNPLPESYKPKEKNDACD